MPVNANMVIIMRVLFNSMTLPKKAAKRIKSYYYDEKEYWPGNKDFKLSTAQTYTAWILGYSSWHELEEVTKNPETIRSKLDEELTDSEFYERIEFQLERLKRVTPVRGNLALNVLYSLQVSSSTGKNTNYYDYSHNRFYYSEEFDEIGLFESVRSSSKAQEIYDIADEEMELWRLVKFFEDIIEEQPENLLAYSYYLSILFDNNVTLRVFLLNEIANIIIDLIPAEVTSGNENWLSWHNIENRNFMRVMFNLGLLYCRCKEYEAGFALIYSTIVTNDVFKHDLDETLKQLKCIRKYKTWAKSVNKTKTLKSLIEDGVKATNKMSEVED